MALINHKINPDLDTMFLTSEHQYMYLSSSTVKELGMYDVDLSVLDKILTVSKEKIESKATKSVKKSVTNLKPFLKEKYQFEKTADFRDALICEVYQVDDLQEIEDKRIDLTKKDEQNIEQIVQNRYANDDWVSSSEPNYSGKLDDYYQGDVLYGSETQKNQNRMYGWSGDR